MIWMEYTSTDRHTQAAQVPELVVNGLGAVLLGLQPPLQLVQHRLSLIVGDLR